MDTTKAWRYMPEVTPPWVRVDYDKLPDDAALVLFVDDEPEVFTFNGTNFKVHPGVTALELPEKGQHWAKISAQDIADAGEKQLARWGVVAVPRVLFESLRIHKSSVQAEAQSGLHKLESFAKAAWETNNTTWAQEVFTTRKSIVDKHTEIGLRPPSATPDEVIAEKWLRSRNLLV